MASEDRGPLKVVWHERYEVDIGPHLFPTAKYRLVRDRLLEEGTIRAEDVLRPESAGDDQIRLVHTSAYVERIQRDAFTEQERVLLEVAFSSALREASWLCAGGSILAGRLALQRGVCVHLGGGFHHAFADHGEGFCLIHDVAVAVEVLRGEEAVRKALVIDLDVHHGNGTAAIFAGNPDVFTFSMHQQNNYPAWKPDGDLDVGLPDRTGDEEYLALLERHLSNILENHRPDLVYYVAGADPYEHDQLGGLSLTLEGLRNRDRIVFELCRGAGAPVAVVLAGGYAARNEDTVEIRCATVREAKRHVAA